MPAMPRVQDVVLPLLRVAGLPNDPTIGSWIADIDFRSFPIVNVRRAGGFRHETRPKLLAMPAVELSVFGTVDLPTTEDLYESALEALYDAVRYQTQTDAGYLHSIKELVGPLELDSPFQDSWRVQGLIQLGVRPPRSA